MNRLKLIGSWLLIGLYAVVMGHNLLPHSHERNDEWADIFGVISSADYPHTSHDHSQHAHSHGFFDFLTSLFNGFNHEDLGPGHFDNYVKEDNQVKVPQPFSQPQLFVVPDFYSSELIPNARPYAKYLLSRTLAESLPIGPDCARGPPIHSWFLTIFR